MRKAIWREQSQLFRLSLYYNYTFSVRVCWKSCCYRKRITSFWPISIANLTSLWYKNKNFPPSHFSVSSSFFLLICLRMSSSDFMYSVMHLLTRPSALPYRMHMEEHKIYPLITHHSHVFCLSAHHMPEQVSCNMLASVEVPGKALCRGMSAS